MNNQEVLLGEFDMVEAFRLADLDIKKEKESCDKIHQHQENAKLQQRSPFLSRRESFVQKHEEGLTTVKEEGKAQN